MKREEMIAAVDQEIGRLSLIRELLEKSTSERFKFPQSAPTSVEAKVRVLSPEARRRIGQAQKQRWAKQKRETTEVPESK